MDLEEEILSRIRAAKTWDEFSKPGEYQVKVTDNGAVLVNLRTGRAQLIYDEDSSLHDLEKLYPTDKDGTVPK